jgi:3-methylcrotonyl-CoA carboxylase alpha subunit
MSEHVFTLGEVAHTVWLSRSAGAYMLHAGDVALAVGLTGDGTHGSLLTVDGKSEPVMIAVRGDEVHVHLGGVTYKLRYSDALTRLSHHGHGIGEDIIPAPMPGTVVAVHVAAGAQVRRGEALLVIESMKLETTIGSPRDGVVMVMHVELGRSFDRDTVLVTLEPDAGSAT